MACNIVFDAARRLGHSLDVNVSWEQIPVSNPTTGMEFAQWPFLLPDELARHLVVSVSAQPCTLVAVDGF